MPGVVSSARDRFVVEFVESLARLELKLWGTIGFTRASGLINVKCVSRLSATEAISNDTADFILGPAWIPL